MPYALTIPVHYAVETPLDAGLHRGLHAILLGALHQADEQLSATVHEMRLKPFTQALLPAEAGDGWVWRITLLDESLYEPLCQGLTEAKPGQLQKRPFHADLPAMTVIYTSYQALDQPPTAERYHVQFLTPTAFKQRTYTEPIPNPYLCFQSWWTRWNEFAPKDAAMNVAVLDIVKAHMVVSHFRLHSVIFRDANRWLVGGVGRVTFQVLQPKRVSSEWWQAAATLAAYAPYCGTGHKTTQGMGQTAVSPL
ncbi:MAG: CRISPR system precrRNA processing endoribonuclease RAMP protein Cas6 [Ardenticatenaceae bacterium]|nr:CRISPR system precrRNA processing endoribonuclease RAMP protein Cas6 [Ardenticatenaceae bacterium]